MNYTKNLVDKLVDKFVYQRMLIYQGFYALVDKFVYQKLVDQYLITLPPPLAPPKDKKTYTNRILAFGRQIQYILLVSFKKKSNKI